VTNAGARTDGVGPGFMLRPTPGGGGLIRPGVGTGLGLAGKLSIHLTVCRNLHLLNNSRFPLPSGGGVGGSKKKPGRVLVGAHHKGVLKGAVGLGDATRAGGGGFLSHGIRSDVVPRRAITSGCEGGGNCGRI